MPSIIKLGPFLTKPAVQAGTDVKIYVDALNPNAYQLVSNSGGGQPTAAPVANVRVDLYTTEDNPDSIDPGNGLYTGLTDAQGMVTFVLPDIDQ